MITWPDVLAGLPLIAILRGIRPEEAAPIGEALCDAGLLCLEVPLNSPEPLESLRRLKAAVGDRAMVGAGTVLDAEAAKAVADAGGELVISPNTEPSVIVAAKARGLVSLPAFMTPSEAFAAIAAGADALKLFPAEGVPPMALKAMKAVLPAHVPVFVVGGVSADADAMHAYLRAGAAGFGVGSALYTPRMNPQDVAGRAAALSDAWRAAKARLG